MSIKMVEKEIERFLLSRDPEIICISGAWGIGKTYAWKQFLRNASKEGRIGLQRYAYVSLFGLNSVEALKRTIFENSVLSSQLGKGPSLTTLNSNLAQLEGFGRKATKIVGSNPKLRGWLGDLGPAWFLTVMNTIVCMDDLERRGSDLSVRDVMGLASLLKDEKQCKVALILNEDAIQEEQKEEFRRYHEKVIDVSLRFKPTPQECVGIALRNGTPAADTIAKTCVSLGIQNIRIIKRIGRLVRTIAPLLKQYDGRILLQSIQSLTLFAWSIYEPDTAPPLEYLKSRNKAIFDDPKSISEKEAAWNALLSAVRFTGTDELDLTLLSGMRSGYFDEPLIAQHASKLDGVYKTSEAEASFREAWDKFHDSFDDNEAEVLDAMYISFLRNIRRTTPPTLSNTVALFKALGRKDQAATMIEEYVNQQEDPRVFDLKRSLSFGSVSDPDVLKAFADKLATSPPAKRTPMEILSYMAEVNGWGPDDIVGLSNLSVDDYYQLLKSQRGDDLRKVIRVCLQFDTIGNARAEMREISTKAKEALRRIGSESPINAWRVKAYGINAGDEAD